MNRNKIGPNGRSLPDGPSAAAARRRGSFLDTPAIVFNNVAKKEAHEKWKERRASVALTHHVVSKANERQKEADTLNDLKRELVMVRCATLSTCVAVKDYSHFRVV